MIIHINSLTKKIVSADQFSDITKRSGEILRITFHYRAMRQGKKWKIMLSGVGAIETNPSNKAHIQFPLQSSPPRDRPVIFFLYFFWGRFGGGVKFYFRGWIGVSPWSQLAQESRWENGQMLFALELPSLTFYLSCRLFLQRFLRSPLTFDISDLIFLFIDTFYYNRMILYKKRWYKYFDNC